VDARSDIYALGVLGFEMITGRLPFIHEDLTEVMHMHLREKVTLPPSSDRPALVDELILGCLEKSPEDRPQDMHEVISALEMIFPPLAPLCMQEAGSDLDAGGPQISTPDEDDSEPLQTPVASPSEAGGGTGPAAGTPGTSGTSGKSGASGFAGSGSSSLPHVPSETLRVAPAPPPGHVVEVEAAGRGLGLFLGGFFLGLLLGMGVLYLIMR
jgi:serine/threonine-protein kinase